MTTYPSAKEYVLAVQDPARSFVRPDLRAAVFTVHPNLRVPMPTSGTAAVVFRAQVGGRDQALRFFIREDASTRERYSALSDYFDNTRALAGCVAHARWVDNAISVRNQWWPLIEMDWVGGQTLDMHVGELAGAGDSAGLRRLAGSWRDLIDLMQYNEFAHGDLQHGNVLVEGSRRLRLVDYDGSWIGAFRGERPPPENGHPNYQRRDREWGRWMDTFPGLVVYTGLLGLATDPELRSFGSRENILFTREDFRPGARTDIWDRLSRIEDPEVTRASAILRACCEPTWKAKESLRDLLASSITVSPAPADRVWRPPTVPTRPDFWVPGSVADPPPSYDWSRGTATPNPPSGPATAAPAGPTPIRTPGTGHAQRPTAGSRGWIPAVVALAVAVVTFIIVTNAAGRGSGGASAVTALVFGAFAWVVTAGMVKRNQGR
jgi:hypothetical protein